MRKTTVRDGRPDCDGKRSRRLRHPLRTMLLRATGYGPGLVANGDNEAWSLYGAQRSQLVATGRKWEGAENGSLKRKPLPRVATRCLSRSMVRRGSTVRARQRASASYLLKRPFETQLEAAQSSSIALAQGIGWLEI
jgi:hypothetical protein